MRVVVLKETHAGERRVALVPESVVLLVRAGAEVSVEPGAGESAGFPDRLYAEAGAELEAPEPALAPATEVPGEGALDRLPAGALIVGLLQPHAERARLEACAARGVTALAMELVPRITRAQRMDVLSSQATVAGYKAVLLAAAASNRFFPMLMTAAGTIPPARVLVLGAGVAGLQAIATARRLGAVVQGFDIRPAVKEQVESLGAQWVGMELSEAEGAGGYATEVSEETQRREREHLHRLLTEADVVITTAQIPGRPAPVLITQEMVEAMRPGAIIMDLAAESGGNCPLTRVNEEVRHGDVTILGPGDLAAGMPIHASQMYSRNVEALIHHLVRDGDLQLDATDEIVRDCLVTADGEIVHPRMSATVLQER
jgi:H+-translocating NAD(P) transhydrogenase subunit alpha